MPLKNILITSSIKSLPSQSNGQRIYIASSDNESFPIETITGSQAGTWPNFVPGTNYTTNLISNVTQSWTVLNPTTLGMIPFTQSTNDEFFNGEFSGSSYVVTNGTLTSQVLCASYSVGGSSASSNSVTFVDLNYDLFPYYTIYNNGVYDGVSQPLSSFTDPDTAPGNGQVLFSVKENNIAPDTFTDIIYVKISKIDQDGNNNTLILRGLNDLKWTDSNMGTVALTVTNETEYITYFLYTVTSITWTNAGRFDDDNILDYTLDANFPTFPINPGYDYITSGWTVVTDAANAFNNGQYIFPLTPNTSITYTASLNITASAPATFSWAINEYDPAFPVYVPDAISSIPFPISTVSNGINTIYLDPGTSQSLLITSSGNYPIQGFIHEIDTYLSTQGIVYSPTNFIINSYLTGSYAGNPINPAAIPLVVDLPVSWSRDRMKYGGTPTQSFEGYFATYDHVGNTLYSVNLNASGGGVVFDDTYSGGNMVVFRTAQGSSGLMNYFDNTPTVPARLVVEIPYVITSQSAGNEYNTNNIYGPPKATITCSINSKFLDNQQYWIGFIPSGTYGTITLDFNTPPSNNFSEICFITPTTASDNLGNNNNPYDGNEYTGSFFAISKVSLFTGSLMPGNIEINDGLFRITQSSSPQSFSPSVVSISSSGTSTTSIVNPFIYSDCNVLQNNVNQYAPNNTRQIVSYGNGSTVPSNLNQIISGTAERATVNEYLYNASDSTLARYLGTRSTSPGFNQNTTEGGYRNLPNVESLQTYFAVINNLQSAAPLLSNKAAANIRYLIDKDQTIQTPSISGSFYWNLIDNFPSNSEVEVILLNDDNSKTTLTTIPVLRPGVYPEPILTSLVNPGLYDNTIFLKYPKLYAPNFNTYNQCTDNGILPTGDSKVLSFDFYSNTSNVQSKNQNVGYDLENKAFYIIEESDLASVGIRFSTLINAGSITLIIESSEDLISWTQYQTYYQTTPGSVTLDTSVPASKKYYYRFKILNNTTAAFNPVSNTAVETYTIPRTSEIRIIHSSSAWTDLVNYGYEEKLEEVGNKYGYFSRGPFWITGSNSKNVLTSSVFYRYYDEEDSFMQKNFINSIFNSKESFTVKPADNIIFNGYPSFNIINVTADKIVDENLLSTNFLNWSATGAWNLSKDSATSNKGATPANNFISANFYSALNLNDLIWVQFDISNWDLKYTSTIGQNMLGIGLGTNISTTNYGQYFKYSPRRNGTNYVILKKYAVAPSTLYFTSDFYFEGTISNLKVKKLTKSDARLFLELDRNIVDGTPLEKFAISRYSSNPNYVLLDGPVTNDNIGFLISKNTTNDLKQDFDKIITSIQEKGLI